MNDHTPTRVYTFRLTPSGYETTACVPEQTYDELLKKLSDAKVAYENLVKSYNMLWKLTAAIILFVVITTILMFVFAYSYRKAQKRLQQLREDNERLYELQTHPRPQSQNGLPDPPEELPKYSAVAYSMAPRESGPAVPREAELKFPREARTPTPRGREESEGIGIALGYPDLGERFRFSSTLRSV
ncbi:hypothetical protein HD806DRAFT_544145 [Xylariaceae sp. AK1471]|nr:hypothetical protein HD806DRAFT_544145 [Xylariaceae sp. AK1471]